MGPTRPLTLALLMMLLASCAARHQLDAGATRMDSATPSRPDAGRDAGPDAGVEPPADAGRACPPNPLYFNTDGGFRTGPDTITPYCERDTDCGHLARGYPLFQRCFDGVCCNGTFDRATCTCSCGEFDECPPLHYCCSQYDGPLRCVRWEDECGSDGPGP